MTKRSDDDFSTATVAWSKTYRGMDHRLPVMDIEERLRAVEERLLLVAPPPGVLAEYPALAEAYKEYKVIETLILGNTSDKGNR